MDIASGSGGAVSRARRWNTPLTLGVLITGFAASLYILFGSPCQLRAAAQTVLPSGAASSSAQTQIPPEPMPGPPAPRPLAQIRRESPGQVRHAASASAQVVPEAPPETFPQTSTEIRQVSPEGDIGATELGQSRENLARAGKVQRWTLIVGALFLIVFVFIAVAVVVYAYLRARGWNKRSLESVRRAEAIAAQLQPLIEARDEVKRSLPKLLQGVGEQALSFQEQGMPFPPQAMTALDDIDHLAYLGDARLKFGDLSQPSEAAAYLNGLLLSAVAHLARSDPWTAFARLDQFLALVGRYPAAVDHRRMAQAYSYRALAAYRVLDVQDGEPSWLRKSERSQTEGLSKQAFADIAQASRLDPQWKHTTLVEAKLSSRFYFPDEPGEASSRTELFVRGLRRAVTLYKGLIDEKHYRGPARHNLARCLKRIAEQTGEKSDFSDFGFALSSFPTDEELSDEALATRQPDSQDRFLWQWMLGDQELFRSVDRLNLGEYRSFWMRLLDNKVHLRNWRADLAELQRRNPAMKDWSVQMLHVEAPISLANAISRRQERFDVPPSGT